MLTELDSDPVFWIVASVAVIATGLAKGRLQGIGMLAVPILVLVVSPVRAAAILLPVLMVQDVVTMKIF